MEEQEQTTPVVSLDGIMADALDIFEGDQKKNAPDKEKETPESTSSKEPGPAKAEETVKHPEKEKKKPESPEKEEVLLKPEASKEPLRFKTHEDAETGYKEIQREKTRLEAELKSQGEEMTSLKDAEAKKAQDMKFEKDARAFAKDCNLEALKKIDALDPDAADYQDQVAEIQADTYRDISRYERDKITEEPKKKPGGDDTKPTHDDDALQTAKTHIRDVAKEHKIDPDDEYFAMVCNTAPTKDEKGTPMDFDAQIMWAINKTENYRTSVPGGDATASEQERKDAAAKKATTAQEANLTLGHGSADTPSKEGDKIAAPISISDVLEDVRNERRL